MQVPSEGALNAWDTKLGKLSAKALEMGKGVISGLSFCHCANRVYLISLPFSTVTLPQSHFLSQIWNGRSMRIVWREAWISCAAWMSFRGLLLGVSISHWGEKQETNNHPFFGMFRLSLISLIFSSFFTSFYSEQYICSIFLCVFPAWFKNN